MDRDALLRAVRAAGLPDSFADQLAAQRATLETVSGLIAAELQRRSAAGGGASVIELPLMQRNFAPSEIDATGRKFKVSVKGARALNYLPGIGLIQEELEMAGVRLDRFASGRAPIVDTHRTWSVREGLGVVDTAVVSADAIDTECRLSRRHELDGLWQDIVDRVVANTSLGYRVYKYELVDAAVSPPLYRAVDWEPYELTLCLVPVDPTSHVRVGEEAQQRSVTLHRCEIVGTQPLSAMRTPAAPAAITPLSEENNTMEKSIIVQMLRAAGLGEQHADKLIADGINESNAQAMIEALVTAQRAHTTAPTLAPAAATAVTPAAPVVTVDVNAERSAAASAERARVTGIHEAVRSAGLEQGFATRLVDGNVALPDAQRQVLEELARRSQAQPVAAGAIVVSDYSDAHRAAIENAILHTSDAAANPLTELGRQYRGLTLMEMGREYLARQGHSVRGFNRMDVAGIMVGMRAGGMMGTTDFPNILANVANKTLRQAYEAAPQTWRPFTRMVTANDFKPISRVKLSGAPALQKVLPSGEFKHGAMSETKEGYQLATYGRIVAINRQTIINDDLDAFTRIPQLYGTSAANLESDTVWSIITSNPVMNDGKALFHANHGNIGSTGATTINPDNIGVGRALARKQKDLDGATLLNIELPFLVVPAELETVALQQTAVLTPAQTTQSNPYAGKLTPIVEPRLSVASATTWYQIARYQQIDTLEACHLAGQEGVYTETRMGFEVDGIEIKVRLDFAAAPIDWKGFVKNGA